MKYHLISNSKNYGRILYVNIIALLMVMTAILPLVLFTTPIEAINSASIWTTDEYGNPKTDFAPGDIVYIHGTGFLSWCNVDIDITRPNCVVDSGSTTINLAGGFVYEYDLDGILGFYFVVASDGINSAQTIFTDNHGAIWTTRDDCGDQQQDVNHYDIGEHVFINGKGFTPEAEYEWFIKGKPGGASCDPNIIVASGTIIANESGAFCFDAYEVQPDDCGEYSVKVDSKNDNYHVNAPWPDEPNVDIEKQVWNASILSWMDSAAATVCTNLSFQINVTNTGNADLTNVVVVDDLPSFLTYKYDASPPPSSASDHQIIWNLGTLTVGSCQLLTFSVHIDTCGFGDNVANVTTDNGVYDEDYVSVDGLPIPSIDVEKKVWNPGTQSWVESIDASAGSTVRFNISIHNDGICSGLMGITVIDTLPPSLGYADDATPREPDDISPDGKQLTWSFLGPLLACNWIYIEFNATVLYCDELDINVVNVSAQCMITSETVYDEDIASVFGQPISSIDIEKKIWDSDTMSWVESIYTPVGNTVRFNISVHNDGTCSDLTNVNVTDFLPPSLEYANSATPFEPIIWADGKHLTWEFAGPFLACNWIYIEFNATVAFVGEGINVVNVSATGSIVYDEDTAGVYGVMPPQPGIDIEKQVWEETSQQWVNEIRVPTGIYLTFKITMSNIGDCLLTNIVVNDTMKSQLEYRNDASVPPSSESPHQVIWNFDTMAPGDIIEITFRAETVHCCHGWNKVNASGYCDINDETVYDEHLVKVKVTRVDDQPIVDITKQVWDAASSRWVDSISTTIGTNLTFRITINCTALTSVNNVVVTDNLPHQLEYRNDASVPPSSESPHQVIWNFDTMAPGDIIEITYHAETVREGLNDNVVTVETSELFYDEDSVLVHVVDYPIVQLTYPSGGEELSGMVNIRWFAVDSEGWGSPDIWLYYSPDSGDSWVEIARHLENTIGDGAYKDRGEYSWSTSSLPDGNYIVRIYAYNSVGNSAKDTSGPFIIGTRGSGVLVSYVTVESSNYYIKNGDSLEISAGITFGQHISADYVTADFSGLGKSTSVPADSYDGLTATWTIDDVACTPSDGPITITVTATDGASTDSDTATITADNTIPELNVISPENALYFFNRKLVASNKPIIIGAINIVATADDDLSGIQKTEIYIDDDLKETFTGGSEWYMNLRLMGQHTLKIVAYDNAGNTNVYSQTVIIYNPFGDK